MSWVLLWPVILLPTILTIGAALASGPVVARSLEQIPLRANDDETSSPREFSLEGAEG